jgi:hypothetical protein
LIIRFPAASLRSSPFGCPHAARAASAAPRPPHPGWPRCRTFLHRPARRCAASGHRTAGPGARLHHTPVRLIHAEATLCNPSHLVLYLPSLPFLRSTLLAGSSSACAMPAHAHALSLRTRAPRRACAFSRPAFALAFSLMSFPCHANNGTRPAVRKPASHWRLMIPPCTTRARCHDTQNCS